MTWGQTASESLAGLLDAAVPPGHESGLFYRQARRELQRLPHLGLPKDQHVPGTTFHQSASFSLCQSWPAALQIYSILVQLNLRYKE